jgi:UDPglucose--hexose-1-phosphate uridylyltransferase
MSDSSKSHSRRNPLTDEWILVSPQRLERPWQGQVDDVEPEDLPPHDPHCPLCPGNTRANGVRNPDYAGPFVFENDFPALVAQNDDRHEDDPLFERRPETGSCRVICYAARHDLRLATMSDADRRLALEAMIGQFTELDRDPDIAYVTVFENRGRMMGCSNPHPHAQAWATSSIPTEATREMTSQRDYFERHGRPLLLDYAVKETATASRVIVDNEHWLSVVPYWATWPYETLLVPRRAVQAPDDLNAGEVRALSSVLGKTLQAYERLFQTSVPYSLGFHPRPSDGEAYPGWQFHIHIYPPLLRSATVQKHMVGFEMLGQPQRDLTPEDAAANLRGALAKTGTA